MEETKSTDCNTKFSKDQSSLVKRPPELVAGSMSPERKTRLRFGSETRARCWAPKKKSKGRIGRRPTSREQPFQRWIKDHKEKIEAGVFQSRGDYVLDRVNRFDPNNSCDFSYLARRYGEDWEDLYGPNFKPVEAERELREAGVPLQPWQRTKDCREPLSTKQPPGRERHRLEVVEKKREENRIAQAARREKEHPEQKEERLEERREKEKMSYRKKIKDQGGQVRESLDPEAQKVARKEAKALFERNKRAQKKFVKLSGSDPKIISAEKVEPSEVFEAKKGSTDSAEGFVEQK